ncbi:MAG: hypothetical protein VXY34_04825 [Bdellovibrionota bacterium]|nr:hypothetical protein [Bdellovibrionota bacterium]
MSTQKRTIVFSTLCFILLGTLFSRAFASTNKLNILPLNPYGEEQGLFRETWEKVKSISFEEDTKTFQNTTIYLVSGISTKHYPPMINFLRLFGFSGPRDLADSFNQQKVFFKRQNISFKDIAIKTNGDPEENATIIKKALTHSKSRRAFIVSHSKGGLDVLYSFLQYPEIRERVQGWIALQTPFMGTPLSKPVVSPSPLGPFARLVEFLTTNGRDSLGSLTQDYRKNFYDRNYKEIQKIVKEIPTIGLGSWFLYPDENTYSYRGEKVFWELPKMKKSVLHPTIKIIYKTDGPNDGLVPMKSSCFEGIQCFLLGNLDHASTVMRTEYFFDIGREKRIHLTRVFLYLLLNKIGD